MLAVGRDLAPAFADCLSAMTHGSAEHAVLRSMPGPVEPDSRLAANRWFLAVSECASCVSRHTPSARDGNGGYLAYTAGLELCQAPLTEFRGFPTFPPELYTLHSSF